MLNSTAYIGTKWASLTWYHSIKRESHFKRKFMLP